MILNLLIIWIFFLYNTFFFDGNLLCEKGISEKTRNDLQIIGHNVQLSDLPHGGGQVIQFSEDGKVLIGGSDPRRDGCALGL